MLRISSDTGLYRRVSEQLRPNKGQWAAYESSGHCVLLAGPGSGKTKTLTLKLARMLAEDTVPPRGVACITYSNECARELEQRLYDVGVEPSARVFIGTVHSFSLTQIVLPYAKAAKLGLPSAFRVATSSQRAAALEKAYYEVINERDKPSDLELPMSVHRRSILDRQSAAWEKNAKMARLVEAYEANLRKDELIDFDDMPLLAVQALQHEWVQEAILAKYPILAVDEYQDLGTALHRIVLGLCFKVGIRLFAVGDIDQSIYGFTGANPTLLESLSQRDDVDTIRLRLNYRCGSSIISASKFALGEERDYVAPEGASKGTVYFHPQKGNLASQADEVFGTILPAIRKRNKDLRAGQIAILYSAAFVGDALKIASDEYGVDVIRSDGNAHYPRSSRLMRWIEGCAAWCCGGWRAGEPRFSRLSNDAVSLFAEAFTSEANRAAFRDGLVAHLWANRDEAVSLLEWLKAFQASIIAEVGKQCRTIDDELQILKAFMGRLSREGDLGDMSLTAFTGVGASADRVNLSTLHSAKGREFEVVLLFGMDQGWVPRKNSSEAQKKESRRLFYVGFTRAKSELHIAYSETNRSEFVAEIEKRLQE
jgi:DNA helicase-2/ATP-dependent DNA helicase PcrA